MPMSDRTPEEWRDELLDDLAKRKPDIERLYNYYRGDHPLPWAPVKLRDAYKMLMGMSRSNWCRLVVKATSERLRVVGMRFSDEDAAAAGDVDAWKRYWQGNRLDAESRMVHDAALIARRGFVLVWPNQNPDLAPKITPEHPAQVIIRYLPGDRRTKVAGLKTFVDHVHKQQFCTLWTGDEVHQWTGPASLIGGYSTWEPWNDASLGIVSRFDNPVGEVPLVEFIGDPALVGEPMGELDGGVTDIQDRINKTILDRVITSNFASFKQKWVTGLDIPEDDEGNPIEPFKTAVERILVAEDPGVRFGEFSESPLNPYLDGVEADIQHLAAITRTPPHYLLGQSGAFPSGESLKSTETGLVAKSLERRDNLTESWEDATRIALKIDGDPRADDLALEMVWKDPESRTTAEVMDAAVKMASIGVPWESIMEFIGKSPTEIQKLSAQRANDIADGMFGSVVAAAQPKGEKSIAPGEPGGLGSAPVGAPAPAGTSPLPPV